MHHFAFVGTLAFLASGCVFSSRTTDTNGSSSSGGTPANLTASFGDGSGPLSTSAAELFGKTMGNPNPKTVAGVYEGTAVNDRYLSGLYLNEAFRFEFREGGVAFAKRCWLSATPSDQSEVLASVTAFTTSAVEVLPWGLRLAGGDTISTPLASGNTRTSCIAELGPIDLPYCLRDASYQDSNYLKLPDGFSMCIELTVNRVLYKRTVKGYAESSKITSLEFSYGVKVAN
jgi:hypothetical protein